MATASPIKTQSRRVRGQRTHGTGAKCRDCGQTNPTLLVLRSRPKLCFECKQRREQGPLTEEHHPAGRLNSSYTLAVPLNSHHLLSDAQVDWERETLSNPSGCPLRAAAACVRGFIETCREMLDRLIGWVPDLLEALSDHLHRDRGDGWWRGTAFEQWARLHG